MSGADYTRLANMSVKDAMRTPRTTGRPAGVEKWITSHDKNRDPWTIEIDWVRRVVRVSSSVEDVFTPLDNVRDYQVLPADKPADKSPAPLSLQAVSKSAK